MHGSLCATMPVFATCALQSRNWDSAVYKDVANWTATRTSEGSCGELQYFVRENVVVLMFQICYAAVTMYFVVGLLPDPEEQFNPSTSHLRAWIAAAIFETGILLSTWKVGVPAIEIVQWYAGAVRLLTVACMIAAHISTSHDKVPQTNEAESLLNGTSYGTMKPDHSHSQAHASPQSRKAGWLDYFISFRLLFPYIW